MCFVACLGYFLMDHFVLYQSIELNVFHVARLRHNIDKYLWWLCDEPECVDEEKKRRNSFGCSVEERKKRWSVDWNFCSMKNKWQKPKYLKLLLKNGFSIFCLKKTLWTRNRLGNTKMKKIRFEIAVSSLWSKRASVKYLTYRKVKIACARIKLASIVQPVEAKRGKNCTENLWNEQKTNNMKQKMPQHRQLSNIQRFTYLIYSCLLNIKMFAFWFCFYATWINLSCIFCASEWKKNLFCIYWKCFDG